LTAEQSQYVVDCVTTGEGQKLRSLLWNDAVEVTPTSEEVTVVLFGELIAFLEVVGGVSFPPSLKTTTSQTKDEVMLFWWQVGLCLLLNREQAKTAAAQIGRFMENATDEILSDRDCNFLILYSDEPKVAREGAEYLQKAFDVPPEYDSVLLVYR
jgi:hypothetical protein